MPVPTRDIFSYSYGEVMNYQKDVVKMGGNYLKINNKLEDDYLYPIYNRGRIQISTEEKLPFIFNINDYIYPDNKRLYISNSFSIKFDINITYKENQLNSNLNIIKINNNQKSENSSGKLDHPLSNIVSVSLVDNYTISFLLGDKENFIKNGNRLIPFEFKSNKSLLGNLIRIQINKTKDLIELFVYESQNNYFYKKVEIEDYNFSKITNDAKIYMFDNSDEINKNVGMEIFKFKIVPSSNSEIGKGDIMKNALSKKYRVQEVCEEGSMFNKCNKCKSGKVKEGICVISEEAIILTDSNPVYINESMSLNNNNPYKINLVNTVDSLNGFNISFSLRRFAVESIRQIPLFSLYSGSTQVLSVSMDHESIFMVNKISNKTAKVLLPSNKELHFLREYFISVSVNLELQKDEIHVLSYKGNQEGNFSDEEESSAINEYSDNKGDFHVSTEDLKIYFGLDENNTNSVFTNFYFHSLVFYPQPLFKREFRVRKASTCERLCSVSCEKTEGFCPGGMEYPNELDLSLSNIKGDIENKLENIPMFRWKLLKTSNWIKFLHSARLIRSWVFLKK